MNAPKAAPVSAASLEGHRRPHLVAAAFGALRPRQWIKNGFIFAPMLFARELTRPASVRAGTLAFLSFSLVASSVYVLNDWFDRHEDRRHPEKRLRPIASGELPGGAAIVLAVWLLLAGTALAWFSLSPVVVGLEAVYLAINALYSAGLKRLVLLDVFAIAIGFVLRVLVGAAAVNVPASHWLLLCTLLLALFLGFSKRRSELELLKEQSVQHRSVLESYTPALITQFNVILCAATVVCYTLYTVAPETVAKFGTDKLICTVPIVLYGLFRYLYLVEIAHEGGNPSALITRDRPFGICIALWLVVSALVVYWPILSQGRFQ